MTEMNNTCCALMKPLFYNGMFNRDGRRMRAVFDREVSNGEETFRLYRKDGKQDVEYPRTETDKYLLYVEQNGYLVSLRCTEYQMVSDCGFNAAMDKLYGGMVGRSKYFDGLRADNSDNGGIYGEAANSAVDHAIAREDEMVDRIGHEPARWADRIQKILDVHTDRYLKSKNTNGQCFPDFRGACVMNELDECVRLSEIYKRAQEEKRAAMRAEQEAEERRMREETNQKAEQAAYQAIQIIKNGGKLSNDAVMFYKPNGDCVETSIVLMLMRRYGVNVPIRTQGWINEKLVSVTIVNECCDSLSYRRYKNAAVSQKFFDCMNDLVRRVNEEDDTNHEN